MMVGLQLSVIFQFYFQGFRNHKLHDVLSAPGTADLTADVDFSYLRKMAQGKTATLGPIKQREFLKNMGIDLRLQVRERSHLQNSPSPQAILLRSTRALVKIPGLKMKFKITCRYEIRKLLLLDVSYSRSLEVN